MGTGDADALFLARTEDLEQSVLKYKSPVFSHFLDPHQRGVYLKQHKPSPFVNVLLWGGHKDAERVVLGIFPDFQEPEAALFPISAIRITGTGNAGHRELLGSLLSLGIKREMVGDLLPFEGFAYVFCHEKIAAFVLSSLERVGRERVQCEAVPFEGLTLPERKFRLVEGTVASLRLDCVLSLALGESRAKVCEYIAGELVNINWETACSPSRTVCEGDVLSVRRFGRMELAEVGHETKKGRVHISVKRYI